MSRIVMTGARGFVGQALGRELAEQGHKVVGLDIAEGTQPTWGRIEVADVMRPDLWAAHLRGVDAVIHTAALVSNAMTAQQARLFNVDGTRRVLDAAVDAGVAHFVHVSSVAVLTFLNKDPQGWLGADSNVPVHEDAALMPSGFAYGDSKIAAEHLVMSAVAAGRIDATIIRPADIWGPGSRPWVLEPLGMMRRRQFVLPMNGRGLFTPVHVDDVVRGIASSLTQQRARNLAVHLGGEQPVECAEYFGHLWRMLGRSGSVPSAPTSLVTGLARAGDRALRLARRPSEMNAGSVSMLSRRYSISNERARDVLGWREERTLDEGMAEVEQWARSAGVL